MAILRIVGEHETTLAELRKRLLMHPATLGQIVERLAKLNPVSADRRTSSTPEHGQSRAGRITARRF